jgi:two-component system, response regulator
MNQEKVEIVLIEDNPADVELTLNSLKKKNLSNRVKILRDGEEALDYLFSSCDPSASGGCPRLILLDLKLPKVSGLEVLEKIRSDERTKMIPVVVLTSSEEEKDRVESYRLGVNSYIVKPVEFESFAKVVSEIGFYWVLLNKPAF